MFFGIILFINSRDAFACGPDFPNNLLDSGDQAVLQPPVADFKNELLRMDLVKTTTRAVPLADGQTHSDQTMNAEMADLAAALKCENISGEQAAAIIGFHMAQRVKLNAYLIAYQQWKSGGEAYDDQGVWHHVEATNPPPVFPDLNMAPGLPREFVLYFQGVMALNQTNGRFSPLYYWNSILQLPPAERHFKSTWAAFMYGKYYAGEVDHGMDEVALHYFERVRDLAKNGFADSIGLATAAIGLEAQIYLRKKNYEQALELYLEQFAAGDDSAVESLRTTARCAVMDTNLSPETLVGLARNSRTRRVITAYLISRNPYDEIHKADSDPDIRQFFDRTATWLDAVQTAKIKDVESAEQLALAAYQADDMDAAQQWITLASRSPVAQWLQAKLLMRAGKMEAATKLLAKLSRRFPTEEDTNASAGFVGDLHVTVSEMWEESISARRQLFGELGVLRLSRREYTESLSALLRSGYWLDAAYVAERVMTPDELKKYVDRNWPAMPTTNAINVSCDYLNDADLTQNVSGQIRYLLARRLARAARYAEARNYFPTEWQTNLDAFAAGLRVGVDKKVPDDQRARALFSSAWIARTNGMELFGTELEPDWAVYGGDFEGDEFWPLRATNNVTAKINLADTNEIVRAAAQNVQPEERFHYRYQAADLAWAAAKLMPDNSEETAKMLCDGGSWLENRDPQAADKFYKALVRRCRQTAIGAAADELRWFPALDENDNLSTLHLSTIRLTATVTNATSQNGAGQIFSTEFPVPGRKYVIHGGDTVAGILSAAQRINPSLELTNILEANPGLNPKRITIGQLIMIPSGQGGSGETDGSENLIAPGGVYKIQSGDTLGKIFIKARRANPSLTLNDILQANPDLNPTRIKVGQAIAIPKITANPSL